MEESKLSNYKLRFYNSRTNCIDEFVHEHTNPINIYTCGPTVYDRVHLGNLKTFMLSDFVVQYLNAIGYKTNHIMNITDIDDKILDRIPSQTYDSLIEYTNYYTDKFLEDIEKLGIRNYTRKNIHKITDNLDDMEQMVLDLIEKSNAYETADGSVYFDTTKDNSNANPFRTFNSTDKYNPERTVIKSVDIKNSRDFVLWKVNDKKQIVFGNVLKKGCIGWNSECVCLSRKVLGKVHICMGGQDLKNTHHYSSIVQAESLDPTQTYGDYWIHFSFLNFSGDKMSKSLGNIKKLEDIKMNTKLLRMYLFSKSYRNDFDFIESEMNIYQKDFVNYHLLFNKLKLQTYKTNLNSSKNYSEDIEIYKKILHKIADNFDTRGALELLIKYINKLMKVYLDTKVADLIFNELKLVNQLFNIIDDSLLEIPDSILEFIKLREKLRIQGDFAQTDSMRNELNKIYIFEDESTGYSLIKKI
jgi:cysteinyl-tRNA synthetase